MGASHRKNLSHRLTMPRITLGDAKNSRLPAVLNVAPTDERFTQYLNEAIERLVKTGEKFYGLYGEFVFCVSNGCITLPRQIANVEAAAVCGKPVTIRGSWFRFIENGPGIIGDCDSEQCSTASTSGFSLGWFQKPGDYCCYNDILGDDKKIKVYCDVAEDDGAVITLQGYDENAQWIRTQVGGEWIDGEQVALNSVTPQTTTKFFSSLVAVQKPTTNGTVRLYEYDTTLLTQRDIAVYEPDETRPAYRRVEIRGLPQGGCCGDDDGDCTEKKVTVMAKLEYIPVANDEDWLLIGNIPALKMELMALMKEENNVWQESLVYHQKALSLLRDELRHYIGSGVVNPVRMQPASIGGAGVRNMI